MDADHKVKIYLLDDKNSWDLFLSKLGGDAAAHVLDDPDIQKLAKEVVRRCGGLPISLITVGRAMSNARTTYGWKDAINKLDYRPAELPGMQGILQSLKFSYAMLKDEALQKCLLYCALFPEDYKILKEMIIDYWICEGFLDLEDYDEEINIEDTRCRGNALITQLQNACLLEAGGSYDGSGTVTLHDTVRDMALWIARHDFVVLSAGSSDKGNASQKIPKLSIWESAQKISLIGYWEIEPPPSSSSSSPRRNLITCPNLTTLLLQGSGLAWSFFNLASMATLRVLDLTQTDLSEFPIEITSLTCLRYLDLRSNEFTSLPVELGNLTDLRHLILRWTRNLRSIPGEAISRLSRLQVLDMERSSYKFGTREDAIHPAPQLDLSDLADLKRLCELHLPNNFSWASLGVVAASPVLRRSTRYLDLVIGGGTSSVSPPPPGGDIISEQIGRLSELRTLKLRGNHHHFDHPAVMVVELQLYPISRLQNLEVLTLFGLHFRETKYISTINISSRRHRSEEPLFPRLQHLHIIYCHGCSELTWVGRLPYLERLEVWNCKGLREVLRGDVDGGDDANDQDNLTTTTPSIFPKLKHMELRDLPSLRSISTSPLLFPCLEWLHVYGCPLLKRLPFGPQSARNLPRIEGQKAWWDGLEWDNHDDRQGFSSKFQELDEMW